MTTDMTAVPAATGDYHLSIDRETAARFRSVMQGFLAETDCCLAAVIERSGAVIVSEETKPPTRVRIPRPDSLGALVAGLFGSTQMLSRQLGDADAPEVICHGEDVHVFLAPLSEEFALMAVFTNRVSVGMIRIQAKQAAESLRGDLSRVLRHATTMAPSTGQMIDEFETPFSRYR